MSIGKIQTLTLLIHQVSINHLFPNIKMYILLTVLYTFLKEFFWTCHNFVTEYPTVIIKNLQFELSSKTDEHIVMMIMCVKSKSSCQQHTCTPAVRWEFLWVRLQRFKCVRDCQLGGEEFWSLDSREAEKPNYESERENFSLIFQDFFLLWHNNNTTLPYITMLKKGKKKLKKKG